LLYTFEDQETKLKMEHFSEDTKRNLLITILLNITITVAQLVGGLISGSLALISDAIHNLSDSVAVILAYLAHLFALKPRTGRSTFGYRRAEILAAFINSLVLIGISVFLVFEAVARFIHLRAVDPFWMFWLGLLGLIANGISVLILHRDKQQNLNIRAAYLHLLGDALTSLAVIAGAGFIYFFEWYWIDPLVTVLISVYLFVHTFAILKESVEILMQMVPPEIDLDEVTEQLKQVDGISGVHHIHVWKLSDKKIHFEAHVALHSDLPVSKTCTIRKEIERQLLQNFDIEHVTLQFEFEPAFGSGCHC